MKPQIKYIFRTPLPQYHSIEELFQSVMVALDTSFRISKLSVPYSGASPMALLRNLRSLRPRKDIVYHITGDVTYMGLVLGKGSVLTIHDVKSALTGHPLKVWLKLRLWFRWPAKTVGHITVISEFTKTELTALIPKQAHKIRVVPNPLHRLIVPDPIAQFNTIRPKVLLMGTKSNKNLERTLEALEGLSIELMIIGKLTKTQQDLLHQYAYTYTNHQSLSFPEVVNCYRTCDLLCFTSLYEGFGMPIIEAQGIGRPVITSNLGAMKEVAGDSALLVDPYDIKAIRSAVQQLITDSALRTQLIDKGFENVNRFQLERIAQQYADIYNELINA